VLELVFHSVGCVIKKVPLGVSFDEIHKLDLVVYSAISSSSSSAFGGFFVVASFHLWSHSSVFFLTCLFLFYGFCYSYSFLWLIP